MRRGEGRLWALKSCPRITKVETGAWAIGGSPQLLREGRRGKRGRVFASCQKREGGRRGRRAILVCDELHDRGMDGAWEGRLRSKLPVAVRRWYKREEEGVLWQFVMGC